MWIWICGLVGVAFFLAVLLSIVLVFAHRRIVRSFAEEFEDYRNRGKSYVGWIVQANNSLYKSEGWDRPAQILIDLDGPNVLDESVGEVARRMAELKDRNPRDRDSALVAKLVSDENYRPFERFLLPSSFTGGRRIYSFHVWVEREKLPGRLSHPFVRCLVLVDEPDKRVVMDNYCTEDDQYKRPS